MSKNDNNVFICDECGAVFEKWFGKCKECGAWNSLVEEKRIEKPKKNNKNTSFFDDYTHETSVLLNDVDCEDVESERYKTGIGEFDRALGGGLVKSSVSLLSGEPGIGKSTLLLQICAYMQNDRILYVSGEESKMQIKMRAKRLGVNNDSLYLLSETDIDGICDEINKINPDIVIIDSVQTMYDRNVNSSAGSVSQVTKTALRLIEITKRSKLATVLVGHVNKEGYIAGPKLLEHMVDVVLSFEGDRGQSCRIVRAIKNRYGSTNEIGLFEMTDIGLCEVPDPSQRLLEDSLRDVSGNCPVCLVEGTRPIIAEVQALVTKSVFSSPKRTANGVDYNRMSILLAVMEKRLGCKFFDKDVYLNVTGGLRLDEAATDLSVVTALLSGLNDFKMNGRTLVIGEVGLSGECRAVSMVSARINEAVRLGFEKIILPERSLRLLNQKFSNIELIPVTNVYELAKELSKGRKI